MTRPEAELIRRGDMLDARDWNTHASKRDQLPAVVRVLSVRTGQVSQTGVMVLVDGYGAWLDAGWFGRESEPA